MFAFLVSGNLSNEIICFSIMFYQSKIEFKNLISIIQGIDRRLCSSSRQYLEANKFGNNPSYYLIYFYK